jgi:hypothetical protein
LTVFGCGAVSSGCGCRGSALSKPGKIKDAGETLCEALNPPQPAVSRITAGTIANRKHLQLNLI